MIKIAGLTIDFVKRIVEFVLPLHRKTGIQLMDTTEYYWALASGLLGFFVGLSELANRYRSFARLFSDGYSWLYMLINFTAAFMVYVIVVQYDWPIGALKDHHSGKVLFCGLSAMALLRSSFFIYKDSNGKTFEVGPAALLSIFTKVAETQFDQLQSVKNLDLVEPVMKDLSFLSASKDLPVMVLASMRVLSSDEQKLLSDEITKLVNDNTVTTDAKNITLGLILLKYTGIDLLKSCAQKLKDIYTKNKPVISQIKNFTAV